MKAVFGGVQVGGRSYPHSPEEARGSVMWGIERVKRIGSDAIEYNVEGWDAFLRGSGHTLEDIPLEVWREVAGRAEELGLMPNSMHGLTLGRSEGLEAILKR